MVPIACIDFSSQKLRVITGYLRTGLHSQFIEITGYLRTGLHSQFIEITGYLRTGLHSQFIEITGYLRTGLHSQFIEITGYLRTGLHSQFMETELERHTVCSLRLILLSTDFSPSVLSVCCKWMYVVVICLAPHMHYLHLTYNACLSCCSRSCTNLCALFFSQFWSTTERLSLP